MLIQWHGGSCVQIQTKSQEQEISLIFNPLSDKVISKMPRLYADIVVVGDPLDSRVDAESVNGTSYTPEPFFIGGAGEYEIKGVFFTGIQCSSDSDVNVVLYRCDIERIVLGYLGFVKDKHSMDAQIEALGSVDILLIPVGGCDVLDSKDAVSIINQIEPRIVIPIHYSIPGYNEELNSLDSFVQEFGLPSVEAEKKFKINKKDLPVDEMKLVILQGS